MHALIIDDNAENIAVLTMLLNTEGVQSSSTQWPSALWDVLETAGKLDVVFLDLEMRERSGFEILADLKSHPDLANVPVIAYSVHTSEIDEVHNAGFDGFLGKPLSFKRFPNQLQRILMNESVWEV